MRAIVREWAYNGSSTVGRTAVRTSHIWIMLELTSRLMSFCETGIGELECKHCDDAHPYLVAERRVKDVVP
jgi:hypothetical protein